MIDWITARVSTRAARLLKTGEITSCDPDGELEWSTAKRRDIRGSHDETVKLKKVSDSEVEISGCPAKFLQGHNVFGSDHLIGVGAEMIARVCSLAGIELLDSEADDIRLGRYQPLRVDINYSFATGSSQAAKCWIKKATTIADLCRRGRGQAYGSTSVVWGAKSRSWSLKAYVKGDELRKHVLPPELPRREQLQNWSDDKLRLELSLMARYLKKMGLDQAASWTTETPMTVFRNHLSRLRIDGGVTLTPSDVEALPTRLRQTHRLWLYGEDLEGLMTRSTLHRHRKELMKAGVNISVPASKEALTTVALRAYLQTPVPIPEWAIGTPLYFHPDCATVTQEYRVTDIASYEAPCPSQRVSPRRWPRIIACGNKIFGPIDDPIHGVEVSSAARMPHRADDAP